MKLAITGASGFVGSALVREAGLRGYEVIGFSRSSQRNIAGCKETRVLSNGGNPDLSGCDAVVHLAGENVFGLWTAEKKKRILESRREGTRKLVQSMLDSPNPPSVLVSASAIGYYGETGEREVDETSPPGNDFLAEVTRIWEEEAGRAAEKGIRVVKLRIALVLGKNGGALGILRPLFRMGLGGKIGTGQQWMAWIHLEDLCRLALFAVENREIVGPLNASAPEAVRNEEFTRTLARVVHRPAIMHVPGFLLKGTLGEFSAQLLGNKRVIPRQALACGFPFRYSMLEEALLETAG